MSTLNLDLPPLPETNGITKKKEDEYDSEEEVKEPSII